MGSNPTPSAMYHPALAPVMIYQIAPKDFHPQFAVVSCFVESGGDILLLRRRKDKPEGGTWGVPAGKVGGGEDLLKAIVRELSEETGLGLPSSVLAYFGKVFVRYPNYDFVYHMFHAELADRPQVQLSQSEHGAFIWLPPQKSLGLPLIRDEDACIRLFFSL